MCLKWKDYYAPEYFSPASRPGVQSHSEALKQIYGRSFIQQLRQEQGKIITIITGREPLTGRIIRSAMDHLEFQCNDRTYHVPYQSILYYYEHE